MNQLSNEEAHVLEYDWEFWARPKQLPPEGDWGIWIIRAGRGFGKTRALSGWLHKRAMQQPRWIALIARTPADARDYNIEGPGGVLRNTMPEERPVYEVSKRRLTWPNGSWATIYSDEEPDQLRGFSGDTAVLDEFAKWKHPQECWDNLQFGMRESSQDRPRILIATTPRPLAVLRDIEKQGEPYVVTVTGSSYENRSNLDRRWFDEVLIRYEGSRLGRQEIHAEYLSDIPNALWTIETLDRYRVQKHPRLQRIVVAVDPSGASGVEDERPGSIGIVVVGKGVDGHGYVLTDRSCSKSPAGWAYEVALAYKDYSADCVVAEINFGGGMVEAVIRSANPLLPVKVVRASRGKHVRAEPVAALYEQGRMHHVGTFSVMEDEMTSMANDGYHGKGSPDRLDALVWAATELMLPEEFGYDSSLRWVG